MVHAWSVANCLCLGAIKTKAKSNEITAIPELLDLLEINDSVIPIDAVGTQTSIAEKIIDKGADYILPVKDNQKGLREEVEAICAHNEPTALSEEIDKGHGRIETRQ